MRNRLSRDTGASSVEYAFVAGLIAVVIVGAVTALGHETTTLFAVDWPTP